MAGLHTPRGEKKEASPRDAPESGRLYKAGPAMGAKMAARLVSRKPAWTALIAARRDDRQSAMMCLNYVPAVARG